MRSSEPVILKLINESYSQENDIYNLLKYFAEKDDIPCIHRGIGLPYSPKKASNAIIKMQDFIGKSSGIRMYHFIISFAEDQNDNMLLDIAEAVSNYLFLEEGHTVFYGIHTNTDNVHIHFAINAVKYTNGRKFHKNTQELKEFQKKIISIALQKLQ